MAIDYDSSVGRVRLLISDTDEPENLILTDEQILAFLDMESDRVRLAAAAALEAIARSEALKSKVIRTLDLQTDGAKLAAELRASAKDLREQDEEAQEDPWAIDIVDYDPLAAFRAEGF